MIHDGAVRTPVLDMLIAAQGRAWLHMPGHGGMLEWLGAAMDTTELPSTDDLNEPAPGGAFEEAQALMAQKAGAAGCMFLSGGSTLGVQAMILAFVPLGGKVIMERNVHKSAIAACAIGDLKPVFVSSSWDSACGRAFTDPEDIIAAMTAHPDARAVFLTRPDYYGACMDFRPVTEACRRAGMALLVDEAHGAHFMYADRIPHAGALGADAWTDSTHKTLPAFTQSACLFFREPRNEAALRRVVHVLGSSSPSFLLAASIDWARAYMGIYGEQWIDNTIAENRETLAALAQAGYGDSFMDWESRGILCDAARLVIDTSVRGISGYETQKILTTRGIDIEMADERRIVCIPPLSGAGEARARLRAALMNIPAGKPLHNIEPFYVPHSPERACGVREAAFSAGELVPIAKAEGRVCAEAFGAYPPGIPLAMPGERIDGEIIRIIMEAERAGAVFFGLSNSSIRVMEEA